MLVGVCVGDYWGKQLRQRAVVAKDFTIGGTRALTSGVASLS